MASGNAEKGGSWRCRSAEGRKRIISEIVQTLSPHREQAPAPASVPPPAALASIPFKQKPGFPPPYMVALPCAVLLLSVISQYELSNSCSACVMKESSLCKLTVLCIDVAQLLHPEQGYMKVLDSALAGACCTPYVGSSTSVVSSWLHLTHR